MNDEIKVPSACGWKNIVSRVGTSLALFGVIIAIMFVFLIGFGINNVGIVGLASSMANIELNDNVWIYDYFGKVYKQIEQATGGITNNGNWNMYSFIEPSLYIPAILCTIISAGVLVTVVTLGIMSIIKLVRKMMGKESADAEKFAFATMLTYFLGAAALKVFNSASVDAYYATFSSSMMGPTNLSINLAVNYNTATIVGIALCAVSLGASLMCRIATRGSELKDCKTLSNGIFTIVSIALAGIIAHFASCASLTMVVAESGAMIYMAMPTSSLLQVYSASIGFVQEPFDAVFFVYMLMIVMQLAVMALAFTGIIMQTNDMLANKKPSSLVVNIVLTVACIDSLVLAILSISDAVQGEGTNMNATFAPCIVALILALLNLCTSVARVLIAKSNAPTANTQTADAQTTVIEENKVEETNA